MSTDQLRKAIEAAVRAAFEDALPRIVDDALSRLSGTNEAKPVASRSKADPEALDDLLRIARAAGIDGLRAALESKPLADLLAVALALDPVLGQQVRRWKDLNRSRSAITDEVMKRVHRYNAFIP